MNASFMLTTQRQNCSLRNGKVLGLQDPKKHVCKKANWRRCSFVSLTKRGSYTGNFYCDVLRRLRENVWHKRPQKWQNQTHIIHHNNAPAHRSFKVSQFLAKNNVTVIPQSPILTRSGPLWLFPLPQAEALDEGSKIRHHWRDWRGIAAGTWHNSKKGLSGMFPSMAEMLGPLYSCKRGVLWSWWRNLTSKASKLLFTSTVLEILDTAL